GGSQKQLSSLLAGVRPEDVAEILDDLSPDQKERVFSLLEPGEQAEVLDETDQTSREVLVDRLSPEELRTILEEMPPDEATDILNEMPQAERREVLATLDPKKVVEVLRLMQHEPESAGGIMTLDYIAVGPEQTCGEVLSLLQQTSDTEVVYYVHVVDEGHHFRGIFSIRELITAPESTPVRELMETELISALVDDDQEAVALLARKYNLKSIPIVDDANHLLGVVTIDDIIDIIADEADEDIYRIAGTADSHPAQQRVWRRALVRIPWLLLPVISGFIIAWLHKDERTIDDFLTNSTERLTILALFSPLVMGIAGGVGTQSATMVVRGIATGDIELGRTTRRLIQQEILISLMIAVAIGGIVALALAAIGGNSSGAVSIFPVAVGLGLGTGVLLASLCGTLIPLGCEKVGLDPALVAGPFITSLNDVVAVVIYLTIAETVMRTAVP
ncbi:MAG TPA: magnesium transporter, partial [Planctomycetes bacterium]|nr:magnesium transporter [Planctomycetota bacterium]